MLKMAAAKRRRRRCLHVPACQKVPVCVCARSCRPAHAWWCTVLYVQDAKKDDKKDDAKEDKKEDKKDEKKEAKK